MHTIGGGEFSQIIPAKNDTFVGAPGAILDGQNQNAYAFTQHATGVTIEFLEIRHFVSPLDQGVVNHDAGANWVMDHNYMHDNGGAALILGDNNTARYNCLDHNAQYGFQIFGNTVTASYNEISHNDSANVESSNPGCGCSGGMKAWEAKDVVLDNNWVHDNLNVGLWVDTNNVGFDISHNQITDNTAEAIIYETSYNFHITNNYIARNGWVKGLENAGFPNPAIYISESGGDSRVGSHYTTSEVANNTLVDNWGGVTLWENANRYCGGAGGDHECTLVNPTVATTSTCSTTLIATTPYIDDCRWKVQNVSVHDNTLTLTRANIPNCTAGNDCGDNALISQYGTCGGPCSPGDPVHGHVRRGQHHVPPEQPLLQQHLQRSRGGSRSTSKTTTCRSRPGKPQPYDQDAGSTLTPSLSAQRRDRLGAARGSTAE